MRKLASIQYVHDVDAIPGSDFLDVIGVLGWKCVVPKGDFKVGDKCVYFEVDSFLPVREEFEFLRKSSFKQTTLMGEGFRLKTIMLRKQVSQGLAMKLDDIPELKGKEFNIGDDVTELLGVRKYEIEEKLTGLGLTKGSFPYFIEKSDEIRIQAIPELLDEIKTLPDDTDLYITTKMDGTSVTMYYKDGNFGVCSRNLEIKRDEGSKHHPFWDMIDRLGIENFLKAYCEEHNMSLAIQGELCGPGIQGNKLKLIRPTWYVFTVQDISKDIPQRLPMYMLIEICNFIGLEHVPFDEMLTVSEFMDKYGSVDALIDLANGKYPSGRYREGIVIRSCFPVYSEVLRAPLSFKVINNKFLLKEEE